jgi:hypothetical protein
LSTAFPQVFFLASGSFCRAELRARFRFSLSPCLFLVVLHRVVHVSFRWLMHVPLTRLWSLQVHERFGQADEVPSPFEVLDLSYSR